MSNFSKLSFSVDCFCWLLHLQYHTKWLQSCWIVMSESDCLSFVFFYFPTCCQFASFDSKTKYEIFPKRWTSGYPLFLFGNKRVHHQIVLLINITIWGLKNNSHSFNPHSPWKFLGRKEARKNGWDEDQNPSSGNITSQIHTQMFDTFREVNQDTKQQVLWSQQSLVKNSDTSYQSTKAWETVLKKWGVNESCLAAKVKGKIHEPQL